MTAKTDRVFDFETLKKQYNTKLQVRINDLDLTDLQKDALTHHQVKTIFNLFDQKWTVNLLDTECVPEVGTDINRNLKCLGIPQLSGSRPSGILYSFYEPRQRRRLLTVHEKAIDIMLYVHWGRVSKEEMANELTYVTHGIEMSVTDIDLIINVSHFLLDLATQGRVDVEAFRAIREQYEDLMLDVSDLVLNQREIDILERNKLDRVYHFYEYGMTAEQLNELCIIRSRNQRRSIADAVDSELRRLGLPPLVRDGEVPVGPFYALYRALRFHAMPGTTQRISNY